MPSLSINEVVTLNITESSDVSINGTAILMLTRDGSKYSAYSTGNQNIVTFEGDVLIIAALSIGDYLVTTRIINGFAVGPRGPIGPKGDTGPQGLTGAAFNLAYLPLVKISRALAPIVDVGRDFNLFVDENGVLCLVNTLGVVTEVRTGGVVAGVLWDNGATTWDNGATVWANEESSAVLWDGGSSIWDSGATTWAN